MAEIDVVMNRRGFYNKPPALRSAHPFDSTGFSCSHHSGNNSNNCNPHRQISTSRPNLFSSSVNGPCNSQISSPPPPPGISGTALSIMNQISEISEGLYLCGARGIKLSRLQDLGITTVVNVTIELPSLMLDQVDYVKINLEDSPYSNLSCHFDKVADKIEETRRKGGNTLVHCVAGISRSATLCIAYLMKYKRIPLRKAYNLVKSRRPIIRPNVGFFRQLVDYEQRLFGTTTVKMVWNAAAGGHIPDLYEPEYNNTLMFLKKYGLQSSNLGRTPDRLHRR